MDDCTRPTPPLLRRTVTYNERTESETKQIEEIRNLQRRRSESRRVRSTEKDDNSESNGNQHVETLSLAVPGHKLSRDGVHYISPYPSPAKVELSDFTLIAPNNDNPSDETENPTTLSSETVQETYECPVLLSPRSRVGIDEARRGRSTSRHDSTRYPDYRAVPIHACERRELSRNITQDAESSLRQNM